MDLPNTRLWRDDPRPMASSPLIVVPIASSVPSCSEPSRYGLARAEHAERLVRRPTLTAPARAAVSNGRVGTKKRLCDRTKKPMKEKRWVTLPNPIDRERPIQGLLRLHSRYGPSDRSIAQGDLCHEAPAQPVTRPSRSSASRSIDNSLGGIFLHW